ncbi:hypothetical protein BS50DRAFT_547266 [Corynespora cassiicola Philippines]|uniref:RTA1-domain-containing protein n=1 Tax=Corynespora cassiicola Philippines TaxID=1448308 RepID=A0A2T2NW79_CORCC|nr:hypothetical protein BS50DRAFT_547266 [Corynespora cassiicola Philippines]
MLFPRDRKGYADHPLLPYNPSDIAAYIFVGLFALGGIVHIIFMFPYRALFPIPIVIGCVMECFSYYFRSQVHDNVYQILPFILSTLLIMGAAPLLAATIYMSLRRVLQSLDAVEYAPLSIRWMSKLFVLADVGCFVSQIMGSAMRADVETADTGTKLLMGGLVTQVIIFVIYIAMTATVHVRLNREPTLPACHPAMNWRPIVFSLYFVSVAFLIRNLVRILEFKADEHSFINSEAALYVFDGVFMLAIVFSMAIFHPGKLMRASRKIEREGSWEMSGGRDSFRPLVSS